MHNAGRTGQKFTAYSRIDKPFLYNDLDACIVEMDLKKLKHGVVYKQAHGNNTFVGWHMELNVFD